MPIGAALGGAIAQWVGLRATFAAAALVHVPLLLGFLVVTERRILDAESAYTSNLSA
jgi:predicted MFS family arabinose efflux permease